jgi:exosortase
MKISNRNLYFSTFTLCLIIILSKPLRDLFAYSWDSENVASSHILLIPFITAALFYWNRQSIFRTVSYAVIPGAFVMAAGLALWAVTLFVWRNQLKFENQLVLLTTSFVVMWIGGFLCFYGSKAFRAGLFPLLFLSFLIPIPPFALDRIVTFLQYKSADTAYALLRGSLTPIYREGVQFTLPNIVVVVARECSGIRSGISLVISCLLAGYMFLRTGWRRFALIPIAVPILIFKNGLRIATLSYLAVHVNPEILRSQLHKEGGIPFFVLALLLMYPFLRAFMKWEERSAALKRRGPQGFPMAPASVSDEDLV